jgi:predicted nucleotidyltransferase
VADEVAVDGLFAGDLHAAAADVSVAFLSQLPGVEAVTLVGSAARRQDANDLDLSVLVPDEPAGERAVEAFGRFAETSAEVQRLTEAGPFMEVDLGWYTGHFAPGSRGWTSGPDVFELAIGNELAYSRLLWRGSGRFDALREAWLPYYGEELRRRRLADARMYAINDLDHVPLMLARDEPFNAFHRLYLAFKGFLQALFISRRTYPVSYDKWIREQVAGILGLPDLYAELPGIVGIDRLEPARIDVSAQRLRELLDEHAPLEG